MGFIFGLIRRLLKFAGYFVLFVRILTLIPNLPPYTKFSSIELEPTLPKVGPLAENAALNNAQALYENKLAGPEAFVLYKGEVYTGLATGEVVKLSPGGHITFVTKIGQPCEGPTQEQKCGRPLGIAIDAKTDKLYVVDAYYGIWKVDLKTDKKQLLVSPRVEIDGRAPKLLNSITLAKNGDFYWTDSSSDFHLNKGAITMFSDPSGRLLYYNAAKNQSKVLLDDLWFPNGIAMSPDNQFVVVAETSRYKLIKYYIDGPKKGLSETFVAGLPGTPDNIRELPDGSGLQVALYVVFDDDTPFLSKSMANTPVVRKFLARMISLAEIPFEFLNNQFPNVIFENIASSIGSFKSFAAFIPQKSALLQVDWNGNIVASYYNTDGSLGRISDAVVVKDKLYTGSPHGQNFVGAVPAPPLLKKAFAGVASTPPPKTAETVTKPVPKPTEAPKAKVEEKKEAPKATKPVAQEAPKPAQQAKPAETVKVAKTAEPVKQAPPKAAEPIKAAPPKPAAPSKPAEPAKVTPKPVEKKVESQTPKPAAQTPPPPKPADSKPTATQNAKQTAPPTKQAETPAKAATPKSAPTRAPETNKREEKQKPVKPKEIPIKEEIPSDTIKPSKETLKVIKREGPAEIPNPNL